MSARPVVGITTYDQPATFGVWRELRSVLLPQDYVRAVAAAGGAPVLLPPLPGLAAAPVAALDALVLAGGADLDPAWYGAAPGPRLGPLFRERDAAEREIAEAALDAGLPVLGVCRGLQVINVLRGGTLHQHVDGHNPAPGVYGDVEVTLDAGSLAARAAGEEAPAVRCHHHQAVDRPGDGLVVTGRAADGVVEALEDPSLPFLLGVQWHPEIGEDHGVFRALVAAA